MPPHTLYVSPQGKDTWSGRCESPLADGSDGPLATWTEAQQRARAAVREARSSAGVCVLFRGGHYALPQPMEFTPLDSGRVTYAAYPGERVVFTGGVRIENWSSGHVNDQPAWIADVSALVRKGAAFRSLFVDGQRRPRTRWPEEGFFQIEDVPGHSLEAPLYDSAGEFVVREGDLDPAWPNLTDIDVICPHFWVAERMPIANYDAATRRLRVRRPSLFCLRDSYSPRWARYYLENVFAALRSPGQWYFDRAREQLIYLPRAGETPESTEVIVPVARQLVRALGEPGGRTLHGLQLRGLEFCFTEWEPPGGHGRWYDPYRPATTWRPRASYAHNFGPPPPAGVDYATTPQAAFEVPGVLQFEFVRDCAVEHCTVAHTGFHAISLGEGSQSVRVVGNTLHDLGAGGILADGGAAGSHEWRHTRHLRITDNTIHHTGHVFPAAAGIATLHGYRHVIAHNHVYDTTYTGISCGWVWGYDENITRELRIEHNLIHHLGQRGALSDLGGIYLLGVQPGTVVRDNVIHDLTMANYGAWGIYLDQGASFIRVVNNLVFNTETECFHEHWGRQNLVRNNLFAHARRSGLLRLCPEPHGEAITYPARGSEVLGNVFITAGGPVYSDHEYYLHRAPALRSALNLHWDSAAQHPPVAWQEKPWRHVARPAAAPKGDRDWSLAQLQARQLEQGSIAADPQWQGGDWLNGNFAAASPVWTLGFSPLNPHRAGPRLPRPPSVRPPPCASPA